MIDEKLALPFATQIPGIEVLVERVDMSAADAIVAVCWRGRAAVPRGQAPVGSREGALPRVREKSGADEHRVRPGQPVPGSIPPIVESVGEVRP